MKLTRVLVGLIVCLCSVSVGLVAKESSSIVEEHLQSLGTIYSVKAPTADLQQKAVISFHAELLETQQDELVMSLSSSQVKQLEELGFKVSINTAWKAQWLAKVQRLQSQHKDQVTGIAGFPCYPTVEETYEKAADLATQYSGIAEWIDIGDSWQKTANKGGYDLKVLKVTNRSVAFDKPVLFIHSAMHAREYATAPLTLDFASQLLAGYANNADMSWIIDNHEVHFLFHMNPDGRKQAEQGVLWRKNTNENYCGATSSSRGADLNRNFSKYWGTTANGSSGNVCDATYRGPSAASEPETQVVEAYVKSLFADRRGPGDDDAAPLDTRGMHLDIHSYSKLVLWPWGHTAEEAPNGPQLSTLGHKLAYWNNYNPIQSVGLYPTDGTSDDVSYGELGVPHYTFELGSEFFASCTEYENEIRPDNLPALHYAAKVIQAPYRMPFGPDSIEVLLDGETNAQVVLGESVAVSGVANDERYQGAIASQAIKSVSYYFDKLPWKSGAVANSLNPTDGAFDSATEAFSGSIDTTELAEGRHIVYFQAEDNDGNKGAPYAAFITIGEANNPPIAEFSVTCADLNCSFDAGASNDDGSIVQYDWSFGDGNDAQGVNTNHAYSAEQSFDVELTVTDNSGQETTLLKTLDTNSLPTADFSVNCDDLTCSFNAANSSDVAGSISSYQWDFGNSTSSTGVTANVTYQTAGTYTVNLTVVDDEGDESVASKSAVATAPSKSGGGGSIGLLLLVLLMAYVLIARQNTQRANQKA